MITSHNSQFRKFGIFSSALIIALVMVVVAGNFTASQSSGTSVTTCYNKKSGAMRYLVKGKCKKTESTLKIDNVGTPGATGQAGATGATGPVGSPGYSVGLSVFSPFDDLDEMTRLDWIVDTTLPPQLVFRSSDPLPARGATNANRLILTSTKLVQVSAKLLLVQVEGDVSTPNLGGIVCTLFRGNHGASIGDFAEIENSSTFLNISESSNNSYFIGSMAMTGFVTASTDSDFAIKCLKYGANPADTRVSEVTLNAVAIG